MESVMGPSTATGCAVQRDQSANAGIRYLLLTLYQVEMSHVRRGGRGLQKPTGASADRQAHLFIFIASAGEHRKRGRLA